MNTKATLAVFVLLLLAILFVPIIPNDSSECDRTHAPDCDDAIGYMSVYTKYVK